MARTFMQTTTDKSINLRVCNRQTDRQTDSGYVQNQQI